MNDQLKQRLVGAIVLVSLAVIFIPMILPGGGAGNSMRGSKVPPEPDYRFPPPKQAPKAPPISESVIVPMGESGTKSSTKENKSSKTASQNTASSTVEKKTSEKPVAVKSVTKPKLKTGQVTAWIVQVGSFSSEANARALRDKLRNMGYASFVEAVKGKEGMNYRVRVGPELTRTLADKLQQQLEKKAKLKGMVQSYP